MNWKRILVGIGLILLIDILIFFIILNSSLRGGISAFGTVGAAAHTSAVPLISAVITFLIIPLIISAIVGYGARIYPGFHGFLTVTIEKLFILLSFIFVIYFLLAGNFPHDILPSLIIKAIVSVMLTEGLLGLIGGKIGYRLAEMRRRSVHSA